MASGNAATLTVKILTDASGASKGIEDAASGYDKFRGKVDSLVPAAAGVVGALALAGTAAANAASRTEQAMGALDSVFGKNASVVKAWADDAATSVGLAKSEYAELASVIGAQFNNLGLSSDAALAGTEQLITLGADLSATFGGSTAQAVEALSSALRGEADPAEKYGLSLNQTAINARLAEQGLTGLTGEALTAAKAQAVVDLATQQAGGALGQYAREADTAAGAQQTATAAWENAQSALGEALLPLVAQAATVFADFAKWVEENSTLVMILAGVLGTIAAAILVASAAMQVAAIAQWALNSAMLASPITWIILAIVALIAIFVYLWNTSDEFRNFWIGLWDAIVAAAVAAWDWIVQAAQAAWDWIVSAWTAIVEFFVGVWEGIVAAGEAAWNGIVTAAQAVWNFLLSMAQAILSFYMSIWQGILSAAQSAWNAITSVVSGVINAIMNIARSLGNFFSDVWNNIVNAGRSAFDTLRNIITSVMNAIMVPINAVRSAFDAVVNAVKNVINWISQIKIPDILGSIGNLFGAASAPLTVQAPLTTAATRGVGAPLMATTAGGRGGVNIYVQGGLDSADTIARRIDHLLGGRSRRTGGVVLGRRATMP